MDIEHLILCKKCRCVFRSYEETPCPSCRSSDVMKAPPWAPLGSGQNIFENDTWEYECQDGKHRFELPIPKSPAENKNRKCSVCNSGHLHLLTRTGALPLYCG